MGKRKILIPLITFLVMVFGCQLALDLSQVPKFILPKPSLVIEAFLENWVWLMTHLRVTLYEAILGFFLGALLGILLALLYLFFTSLEQVVMPLAIAVRNVPFVAIAPLLFIFLGYGPNAKIVIVMMVTFFPVMANLSAGFHSVSHNLEERFLVYQANRWKLFTKLQLPSAIPYLVAGLEIGISSAVIAAIVGELLGTTKGLGFVILQCVSQFRIPLLLAAVVVTTIASIFLTQLVMLANKKVFKKWLIN
jgi:NitT/TauT family transport system permease protein